jgi:hypothetical protein
MRRIPASLGGVAFATALLITPTAAAPAQRFSDTFTELSCEAESDDGTVLAFASSSETFGSFAGLAFWQGASPSGGDPTWISAMGSADVDGVSVTATYQMVEYTGNPEDPFGDPVGPAALEVTLTPVGDPQPYSEDGGSGNQKFRLDGVIQEYSGSGTIDLPMDITFAVSSCTASSDTFAGFANSPASSVFRSSEVSLFCGWEVDGSFVSLFAFAGDFGTESQVSVSEGEETVLFSEPAGPVVLTTTEYSASFDLFEAQDGEPGEPGDPIGSAEASATLTPAGRLNEHFKFDRTNVHIIGTSYAVDGTLSITTPDGTQELAMDECSASDARVADQTRPAPRGRPLANDAPEDALPIAIGEVVTVRTGATDLEGEEPCVDDFGGFPIGHTAWWTFEGTGGDVTIDTAGSDFDTVLGIYTEDSGELVPIGCVDDVDSLQARITVATDAGVTYWIQAGGLGSSSGTLVLTVN